MRPSPTIETGKRAPHAATVSRLAHALHVDPTQFVSQEPLGLTLLTAAEAAFRLDVPPGRVQIWVKQGELAGVKVSGQWRVPAVAVAELGRSGRLRGSSRRLDPRYRRLSRGPVPGRSPDGSTGRVLGSSGNAQAPFSPASARTGIVRAGVVRG